MLIFASKLCIKKMKINLLIFLLTMFTALSCTHKKSADKANFVDTIPMMVLQIQKCSRLYTTEFPASGEAQGGYSDGCYTKSLCGFL